MSFIKEEMVKLGADGVIFHPILMKGIDIFTKIHCEYTLDEIENVKSIPKSARTYYKLVDGKKVII